jgi:uncharacterized membrane protein YqjE
MSSPGGLDTFLDALRSAAGTGVALLKTRVQLFGVDVESELFQACNLAILKQTLLLTALLAVAFTGCALIATFWDSHRVLVSWLVAGGFAALSLATGAMLLRARHAKPPPFAATLHQLEQDMAALRHRS